MYDIAILGGGPGGYVAAERAGALGLSVALVEEDALGGTCLNRGCIPTKSLLNGAKRYKHALDSAAMGVSVSGASYNLAAAMKWKDATVSRLVANIDFLMKKHKVELIQGRGRLERALAAPASRSSPGEASPAMIRVEGRDEPVLARHVVVATGSSPARPPIPGAEGNPRVMTSDEILSLKKLPASVVVIGGGVIGMEFANYFSALGIPVTVVELLAEILPFMDAEAVGVYKRSLKGVSLVTGAKVSGIEGGAVRYEKSAAGGAPALGVAEGELILLATGRRPRVGGIGLEELGIEHSSKGIAVDDACRTNVPGVWAIGDVTGRSLLAHSASAMGRAVAELIAGGEASIPWQALPWVLYGEPEAAGVGKTEDELKTAGLDYAKVSLPARANGRFLAEYGMAAHGLCKLLADRTSGRLLGATVVGPYAGELIWGLQAAMARGATADELEQAVFPHPTFSEIVHDALGGLGL
jgi:dihydrolipoamide dehydrogenase